jgi:ATP-dependent DNA ligase
MMGIQRDSCAAYSYTVGHVAQVFAGMKGHGAEGVVLKRRRAVYAKHIRPGVESRDWLKRRFVWDQAT